MPDFTLHHGDCLEVMRTLPDNSVDAIVTDPPYGLAFMGKRWDYDVPSVEIWSEALRVLKPGGHLLAFAGTRTQHRMAVRIEDAGFEIRDMIAWVYGSGFPKSLDVSKAIDKAAGVEFSESPAQGVGFMNPQGKNGYNVTKNQLKRVGESTHAAQQWQGWGTALKPALEPITLARRPLDGTVAANVLEHSTGALNIDGCRIPSDDDLNGGAYSKNATPRTQMWGVPAKNNWRPGGAGEYTPPTGRWPANFIHDGGEEVTGLLGESARFFYCPKASKRDRDDGLDDVITKRQGAQPGSPDETGKFPDHDHRLRTGNNHPTVKPTDLMAYLCRLVTPPSGVVLDPFMGSGSTGKAAIREGFQFIGIERDADYVQIARQRIENATQQARLAI